jgi:hypothetical protein
MQLTRKQCGFDFVARFGIATVITCSSCVKTPTPLKASVAPSNETDLTSQCRHGSTIEYSTHRVAISITGERPKYAITSAGNQLRWWFNDFSTNELHVAWFNQTAGAAPTTLVLPEPIRFAQEPSVVENGNEIGLVTSLWRSNQNAHIVFARFQSNGESSSPFVLDSTNLMDGSPAIAAGSDGKYAVVWQRNSWEGAPYSLELAMIENDRVLLRRTLTRDVMTHGLAITRRGSGYFVVYNSTRQGPGVCTPPGTGPRNNELGLFVVGLDALGQTVFENKLIYGEEVFWSKIYSGGNEVGIAFQRPLGLGFARLGLSGQVLTRPVLIDSSNDGSVYIEPSSILLARNRYWVGATRTPIDDSEKNHQKAQVIAISPNGDKLETISLIAAAYGASAPMLTHSERGVRGLYLQYETEKNASLRGFEIDCFSQ